jgi:hypothetical protein
MRGIETDRTQLQQQLEKSKAEFDTCAERNYSLYEVDNEVLDRYAHQGAFSYLERSEPFTRIKRTQIDNLVLEYKERAQQLRVEKTKPPAGPPPSAGPPPAANPSPPPAPTTSTPQAAPASGPSATTTPQNGHTPSQ